MFWPPQADDSQVVVRLVNTGSQAWPAGQRIEGAWQATEQPYLRVPPPRLQPLLADPLPALQPGESVDVRVPLPPTDATERGVAWITVAGQDGPLTNLGSAPLQIATGG